MEAPNVVPMGSRWRAILRGESPAALATRLGRRLFATVPARWRCKFCNAPFDGAFAKIFRAFGYTPSRKSHQLCARCVEAAPEGGAVIPLSVLFADIRGYTSIAERVSSVELTALLRRFYAAASSALLGQEAVLAQTAGDAVMAIFVPGLAGASYRRHAVAAGRSLLEAVGYGAPAGNWLEVGVGIGSHFASSAAEPAGASRGWAAIWAAIAMNGCGQPRTAVESKGSKRGRYGLLWTGVDYPRRPFKEEVMGSNPIRATV